MPSWLAVSIAAISLVWLVVLAVAWAHGARELRRLRVVLELKLGPMDPDEGQRQQPLSD